MRKALALAAMLMLVPMTGKAQTQGSIVYESPQMQVWSLTISSGDSIGIHIEGAVPTSGISNTPTFTLSTFTELKTAAMVSDALAAGLSTAVIDLTDKVRGLAAFRFHYGSTGDVWAANSDEVIYVMIRKTRR